MPVRFEWDSEKAVSNLRKHGVSFDEASSVFADPLAVIFNDPEHSIDEAREIIVGHSAQRKLLLVSFTQRGKDVVRISAHEKQQKESERIMKKGRARKTTGDNTDDLSSEYLFDYRRAKPNRFASDAGPQRCVVALDTDLAQVFTTPEAVNNVLRALISTMPRTLRGKTRK